MRRYDNGTIRGVLVSVAGATVLAVGAGVSVNAAEPSPTGSGTPAPACGSVDPGFAHNLEESLRGRDDSADPGFAPPPADLDFPASSRESDPGFARPVDGCPTGRPQNFLASPAAITFPESAPIATPTDDR